MQTQTATQTVTAPARRRGRPVVRVFATVTLNARWFQNMTGPEFQKEVKAACGWRAESVSDATVRNGVRSVRVEFRTLDSVTAAQAQIKARLNKATVVLDS
jgi:hypothetical protein